MSRESQTHLVFVAGLSGSGRSTAMAALEDAGFYCVDNLPLTLLPARALAQAEPYTGERRFRGQDP